MSDQTDRRAFLKTAGVSVLAAGASALEAQTQKPIRLAIVGTGARALAHLAILKLLPERFQVVALADPTPPNLARAAGMAPGAATYSDYRKMLSERKDIDAVVVITPSFLHAEVTVAVFGQGLPVLCEKPMATRVEDANRMIEASHAAGKPLYIGFQKRFQPAAMKMHELAAKGEIGAIQFVSANLFRGDWNPLGWKYTDPKTGVATNWRYLTFTEGSALLEDGIHELDTLNWILNAPVARVMASGGNNVFKQRETVDNAAVIVDYENGARLSFDFSLFAPNAGPGSRRMVLIGSDGVMQPENGKISIRSRASQAVRYVDLVDDAPAAAREGNVGSAMDGETYTQYLAFAETVRAGLPPVVAAEEGKNVIKLVLLAEKSLRTRRILTWHDLPA